jgi:hypothetical protein
VVVLIRPPRCVSSRQVSILTYPAGAGLFDHNDGPGFTDFILGLSLHTGSSCPTEGVVMHFREAPAGLTAAAAFPVQKAPVLSQFLPRRSLYVMTGLAKSTHTHGFDTAPHDLVDGQQRPRQGTRMSFTFRSYALKFIPRVVAVLPAPVSSLSQLPTTAAAVSCPAGARLRRKGSISSVAETASAFGISDPDLAAAIAASLSDAKVGAGCDGHRRADAVRGPPVRGPRSGIGLSRRSAEGLAVPVVVLDDSDNEATPSLQQSVWRHDPPTSLRAASALGAPAPRSEADSVIDLSLDKDSEPSSIGHGSGKRKRRHVAGTLAAAAPSLRVPTGQTVVTVD